MKKKNILLWLILLSTYQYSYAQSLGVSNNSSQGIEVSNATRKILTINPDTAVGIGTVTPSANLDIVGANPNDTFLIKLQSAGKVGSGILITNTNIDSGIATIILADTFNNGSTINGDDVFIMLDAKEERFTINHSDVNLIMVDKKIRLIADTTVIVGQLKATDNILLGNDPGTSGDVLISQGPGMLPIWGAITGTGDDLGDHIAVQNIELNGKWLSNDGGNEGVFIDAAGNVGIGMNSPTSLLAMNSGSIFSEFLGIQNTNSSNGSSIFSLITNGSGNGINVSQTGNGKAAEFVTSNTISSTSTLVVSSDGQGSKVAEFNHTGSGSASTDYAVYASVTGGGGGTTNNIAGYFSATGATNNYAAVFPSGLVGIGTTTPLDKLHIYGSTSTMLLDHTAIGTFSAAVFAENNTLTGHVGQQGSTATPFAYEMELSNYAAAASAGISLITSGGNTRLRVQNDGKVGIGTTTPDYLLTLSGSNDDFGLYSYSSASNGAKADIEFLRSRGTESGKVIVNDDDKVGAIRGSGYDGANFQKLGQISFEVDGIPGANDMPGRIVFSTTLDGTTTLLERMRIDNNGNVGVGTNSPSSKFHVVASDNTGDIKLEDTFPFIILNTTSGDNAGMNYQDNGTTKFSMIYSSGDDKFYLNHLSSPPSNEMTFDGNGNIGIKTNSPSTQLDVNGSGNFAGSLSIGSNLTVTANLTVNAASIFNSTVQIANGTQGNGKILTSDGSGFATWQTIPTPDEIADANNNTKIQVEEGPDDDIIRFDINGSEKWLMLGSRLESNNTGLSVFIGKDAGLNDDLSSNLNVFLGYQTGKANTTGNNNVAIGGDAMQKNTSGGNNISIGVSSSLENVTGDFNTTVGVSTSRHGRAGNYGTAIGYGAMTYANNTLTSIDNYNVGVGAFALRFSASSASNTGIRNSALGSFTLYSNTSGGNNVAVGYDALRVNTSGDNNTALGYQAGNFNTIGSKTTFVGYNADASSNNLINATAIGADAVVSSSNALILGNNANVGIGTSSPNEKLQVNGDLALGSGTIGNGQNKAIVVYLENFTSSPLNAGDIVTYAASNRINTTTTPKSISAVGVLVENCPGNGVCKVAIAGVATVNITASGGAGKHCVTSGTAGLATHTISFSPSEIGSSIGVFLTNTNGSTAQVLLR